MTLLLVAALLSLVVAQQMPLRLLSNSVVSSTGAQCLDGSAPGYYIKSNPSVTKWIVFIAGGGWCNSLAECAQRATTQLGSSTQWQKSIGGWGLFSPNATLNPYFSSWNSVYIPYCDGASFSGDVDRPIAIGNQTIYFRGRRILEAIFDDLTTSANLGSATEFILSGCSAGGLSTFLHADRVQSWLPASAKFGAVPESGFFLNHTVESSSSNYVYGQQMRGVFKMQNATAGVDDSCVQANLADPAVCIFAPVVLNYVAAPLFVLNSMYDSWQMNYIFGLSSPAFTQCAQGGPTKCDATTMAAATTFRGSLQTQVARHTKPTDGYFLDSCWNHCEFDGLWDRLSIQKFPARKAVEMWWATDFHRPPRLVDCMLTTKGNCNPTC